MVGIKTSFTQRILIATITSIVALFFGLVLAHQVNAQSAEPASNERLLSVYDEGVERGVLTRASTLREAFQKAGIRVDPNDRVEPGIDDKLEASHYEVNIYRARPVTIIDGA